MGRTGAALRPGRAAALVAVPGLAFVGLGRAAVAESGRLWAHRDALAFDDLVLACAVGVLTAVTGWLCLAACLTGTAHVLERTQGVTRGLAGRLSRRITPSLYRSLLAGACGAVVLAAPTATAAAASGGDSPARGCVTGSCSGGLSRLPLPDRPGAASAAPASAARVAAVRVRRDDTLWAVAARHLSRRATDADIAAAWPVWFSTNRARVGPDPDLIQPRTRLVVPWRFR